MSASNLDKSNAAVDRVRRDLLVAKTLARYATVHRNHMAATVQLHAGETGPSVESLRKAVEALIEASATVDTMLEELTTDLDTIESQLKAAHDGQP